MICYMILFEKCVPVDAVIWPQVVWLVYRAPQRANQHEEFCWQRRSHLQKKKGKGGWGLLLSLFPLISFTRLFLLLLEWKDQIVGDH